MNISSRTPEGSPARCPVCGAIERLEPCYPAGDAVCPACGQLFWLVQQRLVQVVGAENDVLPWNSDWRAELGADSLDTVELVMELEEEFDIVIPDDDAERIQTVRDLVAYLRRRQRGG